MKLATASTDRTVYDFKVLLEPHKEAGGYVVSCPALEGKSLKEVIDQIIDELRGEFPNAEFLLDGNGTDLSDGISRKPVLLLRFDTIVVDLLLREIS